MWLVCTGSIAGNLPFRLEPRDYVVGRSRSADLLIKDFTLSRRHALLSCDSEGATVRDLGSLNGTFVNEQPAANEAAAYLGDRIRFGSVTCMLCSTAIIPAGSIDGESTFAAAVGSGPLPSVEGLTRAQQQVLKLVLQGCDEAAIAQQLDRSWHTVHTHLKAIYKHFEVHTRVELVALLLRRELKS
ncbi:MAG TPA: FHA domain-containing protein [Pirellulaceae bacterium]|nr:FHA domain-containing protein [Pirellulaceae bacterium]